MRFIPFLIVALLFGCITKPTQQQIEAADFGNPPAQFEEVIRGFFKHHLKDYDSAKIEFEKPGKGYFANKGKIGDPKGKTDFGWIVLVNVNAKNSYGGYAGFTPYSFFFMGEELKHWKGSDGLWN